MTPIRLQLLGKCTLHVGDEDRTAVLGRTGKGTGVLALLCLSEGNSCEPLYLQELLWPDSESPEKRAANYRQQVHRLRKALGESSAALITERNEIRLDMHAVRSDVNTFLNCLKQTDWKGALEAYGGSLLPRLGDAWVDEARGKLRKQYLDALAARVEELKHQKPGDALVILERWSDEAPESAEQIQWLRWEILVILNRQAEALAEAESYCARNPDAEDETRDWLKRLQKPPRLNDLPPLPVPWTPFIGRQDELAQLVGRVRGARLFTLCGEGGIGKTRMALELAQRLYDVFDQQVAFIDLSQLPAGAKAEAVKAVLEQTLKASLETIARARALLILDNAEHVLPAVGKVVQSLLGGGQQLQLLLTSRQELGYRHERKLRLHGLLLEDATELFIQISPVIENLADPGEKAALKRLYKHLEGWPLIIELTASRREAFDSLQALEANLEQALLEASASPDDPTISPRELTLNTTLDWSAHLLEEATRNLWHACPSFVGGISPEALAGVTALPVKTVQTALQHLASMSLLRQEEERFRVLEPVRTYLKPKEVVQEAFASYFLELAEGKAEADVLLAERANLIAAGEWMLNHTPQDALRLSVAVWRFWWESGDLPQGFLLITRALKSVGEHPLRTEALLGAGALAYGLRLLQEADEIGKEALERAQVTGDPMLEARAWLNWGLAAIIPVRDTESALMAKERFLQAEPLFASKDSIRGVRMARSNQLLAALKAGEVGLAEQYEEALAEFDAIGDIEGWLTEANNYADLLLQGHNKTEARAYFAEIVRRAHTHSQRRTLLQGLQGLANVVPEAQAAWLTGALDRLRLEWGLPLVPEVLGAEQVRRWNCESVLGTAAWNAALEAGAALPDDTVVQRILKVTEEL